MPDERPGRGCIFTERLYIEAEFITLSAMHVGTGEFTEDDRIKNDEGENAGIAKMCRDEHDQPYVPGTALKGILRDVAGSECAAAKELFGEISHKDDGTGRAGKLVVYGAVQKAPGKGSGLPHIKADGTFIAAQTAINPATGTADPGKLFYKEMCAPGARFLFRARLMDAGLKEHAYKLLAALAVENGLAAGKGQADGLGRLQLDVETLVIKRETLEDDGEIRSDRLADFDLKAAGEGCMAPDVIRLILTCDGPYVSRDWSWDKPKRADDDKSREQVPDIKPLRSDDSSPLLNGTLLTGAMRARANWLAALEDDPGAAEWVKLIFGDTGKAALLRVDRILLDGEPALFDHTSVKLDRFSGAPVDGALVTTRSFVNSRFEVTLSVSPRAGDEERGKINGLIADLVKNGIMLGHGTNMGFGWFEVQECRD